MSKYNNMLKCVDCPKSEINWDTLDLICELTGESVNPNSVCKSHPHWNSFSCDDCIRTDCNTRDFGWNHCLSKKTKEGV